MARADPARAGITTRCAIYTRKSSDEGLEQEFNSLDAQREACEAYIVSQRHAGWIALVDMYDDGGLSGGSMERPALKRLLEDIKASRVQIVVVYKVDRLTRSLSDFSKIVDVLDAHNASFVSVTQQFNTTTSMGRLTLNMLLSFAQFEREIAGERIRDKIAASKKKGMWMGGNVPLGYDVKDRKLIVNEIEASTVRLIFRRYAGLSSVSLLSAELNQLGIMSKCREGASGRLAGNKRFSRGALYLMLQNRIWVGERGQPPDLDPVVLSIEAKVRRAGKGKRLVIENGAETEVNAGLVELIKEAFAIRNQFLSGSHDSIEAMSGRLGMNKGRLTSLVRLSYLGPEIVRALLAGSQSNALTPSRLLRLSKNLPHDWKEQRCFLCFAA